MTAAVDADSFSVVGPDDTIDVVAGAAPSSSSQDNAIMKAVFHRGEQEETR